MIKASGNPYASLVEDGIETSDVTGYINTGSYILNGLLSGSIYKGIPNNKITSFSAPEASGKTWFAMSIVKSFLDSNPEAVCFYFDSESSVTSENFKTREIDPNRVVVIPVITIEEFRTQAIKIIDNYLEQNISDRKPIIMVCDSLGNLSTIKEITDISTGSEKKDMTRAALIKGAFRVLTVKLGIAKIPLVVCNHTYPKIGTMYPEVEQSGGSGIKYAGSTMLLLSKRKEKQDGKVIGNVIHCKTYKSRFTKENQIVDVLLTYDGGLDKYYGLLPIAERYGIFKKVSTRYEMPDGSKVFESAILNNPEKYYTKEVMEKINLAVAKEFKYANTLTDEEKQMNALEEPDTKEE